MLEFGSKDDRLINVIVRAILVVTGRVSEVQAEDGLFQSHVQAESRSYLDAKAFIFDGRRWSGIRVIIVEAPNGE